MQTYTIKDISRMFHMPASTLRYYEALNILTNIQRTPSGRRIYEQKHVNRLRSICCMKRTGLPLSRLQIFFAYEADEAEHLDDILNLLSEQRRRVLQQLMQLQLDLAHVNRKLHYYHDIKAARATGEPHPNWSDYREKQFTN